MIFTGNLTSGALTRFAIQSIFVGLGFSGMSTCYSDVNKGMDAVSRVFSLIDRNQEEVFSQIGNNNNEEVYSPASYLPLTLLPPLDGFSSPPPLLQLEDVYFSYPGGEEKKYVLQGVSVTLPSFGITCFCGPSGGGKSTLASLIIGLRGPTRGTIRVAEELGGEGDFGLLVGVVEQSPCLLTGSISFNIGYGKVSIYSSIFASIYFLIYITSYVCCNIVCNHHVYVILVYTYCMCMMYFCM